MWTLHHGKGVGRGGDRDSRGSVTSGHRLSCTTGRELEGNDKGPDQPPVDTDCHVDKRVGGKRELGQEGQGPTPEWL